MGAGAAALCFCREKPRHRDAAQLGGHWEGLLLCGTGPVPVLEAAGVYQQDPTYSIPLHASGPHTALRIWGLQRCPAPVLERTRDFLRVERALCRGKLHVKL